MGWFGNLLSGSNNNSGGGDGDDNDNSTPQQQRRRPRTTTTTPSASWNTRTKHNYHGGGGHDNNNFNNDDLYLSDDDDGDDDWGMSSSSARRYHHHNPTTTMKKNQHHQYSYYNDPNDIEDYYDEEDEEDDGYDYDQQRRRRRQQKYRHRSSSSSAFWDQISMNDESSLTGADHINNNNNGNSRGAGDSRTTTTAEEEVQEDIRSLEQESTGDDNNDAASTTSSNKEEVVNAYRDYLKSIRDGGFESYLDNTTATATGGIHPNSNHHHNIDEDGALERGLDMEEERASGSLYGDMYGVHDMRGMASGTSPYSEWRAKAKALLRQEEVLDKRRLGGSSSASPSRKILDRFRRKRSAGTREDGRSGGTTSSGHRNRFQKRENNGYADEHDGRGIDDEYDNMGVLSKYCGYRIALFRRPLFRGVCVLLCVLLAFGVGISYYMRNSSSSSHEEGNSAMPSEGGTTEHGINAATEQSSKSQSSNSRPSDAILNALSTFEPVWFDRRTGWEGITFMDAVHFCASHKDRVPCPYEIYCNKDDGTPYDGTRSGGEQWAAISNGANQWVQVGEMFTCQRYTDLHDRKKPEWGITGISSEHEHGAGGITQNLMCCMDVYRIGSLDPFTQWGKNDEMKNVEEDSTKETTDSASVNVVDTNREENPTMGNVAIVSENSDAQKQEKAVIAAFQPIWFSSTHGWSGKSYEDAILFCESYNHMVLCPYAAYCPNGHAHSPLPGSMISEIDGEQWAPANGPMNTWVQVGTVGGDESTRCTLHHEMLGERPEWGIDGTRSEIKHHILCCLM